MFALLAMLLRGFLWSLIYGFKIEGITFSTLECSGGGSNLPLQATKGGILCMKKRICRAC